MKNNSAKKKKRSILDGSYKSPLRIGATRVLEQITNPKFRKNMMDKLTRKRK